MPSVLVWCHTPDGTVVQHKATDLVHIGQHKETFLEQDTCQVFNTTKTITFLYMNNEMKACHIYLFVFICQDISCLH